MPDIGTVDPGMPPLEDAYDLSYEPPHEPEQRGSNIFTDNADNNPRGNTPRGRGFVCDTSFSPRGRGLNTNRRQLGRGRPAEI